MMTPLDIAESKSYEGCSQLLRLYAGLTWHQLEKKRSRDNLINHMSTPEINSDQREVDNEALQEIKNEILVLKNKIEDLHSETSKQIDELKVIQPNEAVEENNEEEEDDTDHYWNDEDGVSYQSSPAVDSGFSDHQRRLTSTVISDSEQSVSTVTRGRNCRSGAPSPERHRMKIDLDLRPKTSMLSTSRMSRSSSMTMTSQQILRKFHVEQKIFHQLLELKKNQIRAGRASEGVMVKRIADKYNKDLDVLYGMKMFKGDYSFRSFEEHLYQELNKVKEALRKIDGSARSRSLHNSLFNINDEKLILPKIDNRRNHQKFYSNRKKIC